MYTIASFPQHVLKAVINLQTTQLNLNPVFTIGLAYVIARDLSIPVEKVEDVEAYYRIQHSYVVSQALSEINELMPFNLEEATENVKAFYKYRVSTVYPQAIPLAINPEKSLHGFFGLNQYFSDEMLETISTHGEKLTMVIGLLLPLQEELKKRRVAHNKPADIEASAPEAVFAQ